MPLTKLDPCVSLSRTFLSSRGFSSDKGSFFPEDLPSDDERPVLQLLRKAVRADTLRNVVDHITATARESTHDGLDDHCPSQIFLLLSLCPSFTRVGQFITDNHSIINRGLSNLTETLTVHTSRTPMSQFTTLPLHRNKTHFTCYTLPVLHRLPNSGTVLPQVGCPKCSSELCGVPVRWLRGLSAEFSALEGRTLVVNSLDRLHRQSRPRRGGCWNVPPSGI